MYFELFSGYSAVLFLVDYLSSCSYAYQYRFKKKKKKVCTG